LALDDWVRRKRECAVPVPLNKTRVLKMQVISKANDRRPTTDDDSPRHRDFPRRCDSPRRSEQGYILLMLMLFVALLAIAAGALAPTIAFRVRRDREEEMIHRGVQYSRAIRRYVKKTGRYPTRLEDLENTNNVRFLRKRYKDPITGKDFKLLHVGEVQLTSGPGIAGASALGNAAALGAAAATPAGRNALMGAASSMLNGAAAQATTGGLGTPLNNPSDNAAPDANAGNSASPDAAASGSAASGGSSSDPSKPDAGQPGGSTSSPQLSSTVFGGGPIVGVASTSKAASIREFGHKNHYNQWQFIYDPTMDRGTGLITTPAQPALQIAPPLQQQNSSGTSSSPSTFGGMQNGMQSAPPSQPTQQQQQ
jgi:type II secretory pathway pseudopilin PulG